MVRFFCPQGTVLLKNGTNRGLIVIYDFWIFKVPFFGSFPEKTVLIETNKRGVPVSYFFWKTGLLLDLEEDSKLRQNI